MWSQGIQVGIKFQFASRALKLVRGVFNPPSGAYEGIPAFYIFKNNILVYVQLPNLAPEKLLEKKLWAHQAHAGIPRQ